MISACSAFHRIFKGYTIRKKKALNNSEEEWQFVTFYKQVLSAYFASFLNFKIFAHVFNRIFHYTVHIHACILK